MILMVARREGWPGLVTFGDRVASESKPRPNSQQLIGPGLGQGLLHAAETSSAPATRAYPAADLPPNFTVSSSRTFLCRRCGLGRRSGASPGHGASPQARSRTFPRSGVGPPLTAGRRERTIGAGRAPFTGLLAVLLEHASPRRDAMARNYYSEINLHVTWHTKESAPLLVPKVEAIAHHYLRGRCINSPGVFIRDWRHRDARASVPHGSADAAHQRFCRAAQGVVVARGQSEAGAQGARMAGGLRRRQFSGRAICRGSRSMCATSASGTRVGRLRIGWSGLRRWRLALSPWRMRLKPNGEKPRERGWGLRMYGVVGCPARPGVIRRA
jgi:hypothetical protein